ncbi:hypothetical protein TeGR_g13454, partial [Tetraparma gracilis]
MSGFGNSLAQWAGLGGDEGAPPPPPPGDSGEGSGSGGDGDEPPPAPSPSADDVPSFVSAHVVAPARGNPLSALAALSSLADCLPHPCAAVSTPASFRSQLPAVFAALIAPLLSDHSDLEEPESVPICTAVLLALTSLHPRLPASPPPLSVLLSLHPPLLSSLPDLLYAS